MTLRARIIAFLLGLIILFIVSFLIRRRRLYNVYAIMWFLISLVFLSMALFPRSVEALAGLLGIFSTPIAILVIAIGGMLGILLHISIILTEHHKLIRKYEKEIALLRMQESLKDKNQPSQLQ